MATGPGAGDPVQGGAAGEHRRGEAGKVSGLPPPLPLCQPLPHQRVSQRAGFIPGQLCQLQR